MTDVQVLGLVQHKAVLAFLQVQQGKQLGETRESLAAMVYVCQWKGSSFARRIITWGIERVEERKIKEGERGYHVKTRS